jgi:hypothetical protein
VVVVADSASAEVLLMLEQEQLAKVMLEAQVQAVLFQETPVVAAAVPVG